MFNLWMNINAQSVYYPYDFENKKSLSQAISNLSVLFHGLCCSLDIHQLGQLYRSGALGWPGLMWTVSQRTLYFNIERNSLLAFLRNLRRFTFFGASFDRFGWFLDLVRSMRDKQLTVLYTHPLIVWCLDTWFTRPSPVTCFLLHHMFSYTFPRLISCQS